MKLARLITAILLSIAMPLPALAQPHVIAELGTAPLIGTIASTPQLQADVTQQRALFESAGTKLGLTPQEYAQFQARISARRLAYVTIPRRLDAMSWSSGGQVYVLHDVVIPANTKGWEIDLQERNRIVALFIPARCGNLSVLRKPLPVLAKAPAPHRVAVAAEATAPPSPAPMPVSTPAPMPAAVVAMPAAPAATPAPYQAAAASTPAVHHARLWPLLLIPVLALLAGGHGGQSVPSIGTAGVTAPPAAPTPPPASCATPPPH